MTDESERMIGSKHGLASAIVIVRGHIGRLKGPQADRIDPRHVRKIKQRDAILRPLVEIEKRLVEIHASIKV